MMQDSILQTYKTTFPKDTLAMISKRTGINQTRVFRIFNGYEMKISEYETFEQVLYTKGEYQRHTSFIDLAKKCLGKLSQNKIEMMSMEMKDALQTREIIQNTVFDKYSQMFA